MLTDSELKTLALVCDTLVPSIKEESAKGAFYERSATQLGVDKVLAAIIESKLEPSRRIQFHRLLRIFESRSYNLMLNGTPRKFSELTERAREERLQRWRDSRISAKRVGFQALKRLVCLLFYSMTDQTGANPNWDVIGYPRPQQTGPLKHPEDLKITPISPEKDLALECEVCVVGSGAGGSVIASELSKSGLDVLVIESGGYETAESFQQYELRGLDKLFVQHGFATTEDLAFILLAGRGAGGGTVVNWCTSMNPPRFVLDEWENEYGIDGVRSPEFGRFVDEVRSTLKINDRESQRNLSNEVLWKGCRALNYREGIDFEVIQRDAVGCNQRCAFCTYGCVYSCKQSTIMNYLPMAFKQGARFLFNTEADNVLVENGTAKGVEATCSAGDKKFKVSVRSKAVVVACGAINTPALLLRSGIKGKNIGRNLRLHPTTAVAAYFDQVSNPWEGPPQTVAVRKFMDLDGTHHGFWAEAVPVHPGLFAQALPWVTGRNHKEIMMTKLTHLTATIVLLREWGSGRVRIDKYGSPVVDYDLEGRDKQNLVKGINETARILGAAGASEIWTLHSDPIYLKSENGGISDDKLGLFFDMVESKGVHPNRMFMGSAHIMGSCSMNADESKGAVSPHGELYGVENLFVGDASVFPTAPGVNPMVTIMAMAKRTAEFMKLKLRTSS